MIMKYATELADDKGKPTGEFVFKPSDAKLGADEILSTHMSMTKPEERKAFLDKNFDEMWKRYDTANEGQIAAQWMQGFYRSLVGNNQIEFI